MSIHHMSIQYTGQICVRNLNTFTIFQILITVSIAQKIFAKENLPCTMFNYVCITSLEGYMILYGYILY